MFIPCHVYSPGYRQVLLNRLYLGVPNINVRTLNTARKGLTHFIEALSGIYTLLGCIILAFGISSSATLWNRSKDRSSTHKKNPGKPLISLLQWEAVTLTFQEGNVHYPDDNLSAF